MTVLIIAVLCVVIAYALLKYMLYARRYSAALNVVLAKVTFERLLPTKQAEVNSKAHEILARLMTRPPETFETEVHRFGWYALAMAELGIQPAFEEPRWILIPNPFLAVVPGDPAFKRIVKYLKRKYGIDIQLKNEKCPEIKVEEKPKPAGPRNRTYLDEFNEVAGSVIVGGYRTIASRQGCAPSARTTDEKIVQIYVQVGSAFQEAAKQRGEHIPAQVLNFVVLHFLQLYETADEQMFHEHLRYEIANYLKSGLRTDYQRELPLI